MIIVSRIGATCDNRSPDIADPGIGQLIVEIIMNVIVRFILPEDEVLSLVSRQGFYLPANKNWTRHMLIFII